LRGSPSNYKAGRLIFPDKASEFKRTEILEGSAEYRLVQTILSENPEYHVA
jgi:hypothetical protein